MSRNWLAPPGTARRVQLTLLLALAAIAIGMLAALVASLLGFGDALNIGVWGFALAALILTFVPMRVSEEQREIYPGPREQLFQLAADPKLRQRVLGTLDRRRLVSQNGPPGQPGSTYVTEGYGLVLTTTVVTSDPPRTLVTATTSSSGQTRIDIARTYTQVAEGTLVEAKSRQRMSLFYWLLRPLFKPEGEAIRAQTGARFRDYLQSVGAPAPQAGSGSNSGAGPGGSETAGDAMNPEPMYSDDLQWWWDGSQWLAASQAPESATAMSTTGVPTTMASAPVSETTGASALESDVRPRLRRRPSGARLPIRLATEGLLAAVLVGLLVYYSISSSQQANTLLAKQLSDQKAQAAALQSQVGELQAQVQDLQERWFGSPAIYKPPRTTNTVFKYFNVQGATQQGLIQSLNTSNICGLYWPCLKDPLNPGGIAWAQENSEPASAYLSCSTPSTTNVQFRQFILLPRWSPPADGTVKIPLVEEWNALMQVLYTHEAGHGVIDRKDIKALNDQAHRMRTCAAVFAFWDSPSLWKKDDADQLAYHARLYADCRPAVGCIPYGWMGW